MSLNGGTKESAVVNLSKELVEARLPAVLSSYMRTDKLPEPYRGIDEYVKSIRLQLIKEAGGSLTQLQMIVLDGICELLIVTKYISTYIAERPESTIVEHDRYGVPHPTDMVIKGLAGLHQTLDKKIKQFHDLTSGKQDEMSAAEMHRRAIMGEHIPTGRPKTRKNRVRDEITGKFLKSTN